MSSVYRTDGAAFNDKRISVAALNERVRQKNPGTALSNTTTLTIGSLSMAVMTALSSGIVSGPKILNGGLSSVTRRYAVHRADSR
jgi:hypothetical protein